MIGPNSRKNRLTAAGDTIHDPLPSPLRNRRFNSILSYSHWPIFTTLCEMTDGEKLMNPQHFGSDLEDIQVRIRINPEI